MGMLKIDGSMGHGQVVRTAVSLSALTLEPVTVYNIRKDRPNPGLAAQHKTGIEVLADFCDAEVDGLEIGSTEVKFNPSKIDVPDKKKIDIGTSGSISLLLQTLTPICLFAGKQIELDITGGTSGLGAPTIEYLNYVTFMNLKMMGIPHPGMILKKQGFYPKGGGNVIVRFYPIEKIKSIAVFERGSILSFSGKSVVGSLPEHIADRQSQSAKEYLENVGILEEKEYNIEKSVVDTDSPGTSITVCANCQNGVLGADNLGERGVPAEDVGRIAAEELHESLKTDAPFDKHMGDQIIPFLGLAKGNSIVNVDKITDHCKTNIKVVEKILGSKFETDGNEISCDGIGFEL